MEFEGLLAVGIALATAVAPVGVEYYKEKKKSENELIELKLKNSNLIRGYSDIINEYIAYLNSTEISSDKFNDLNRFRLKSEKQYNEIIMTFSVPEYWEIIILEDFEQLKNKLIDGMSDREESLLNLIRSMQVLLRNNVDTNASSDDKEYKRKLLTLNSCLLVLLSDYYLSNTSENSNAAIIAFFREYDKEMDKKEKIEQKLLKIEQKLPKESLNGTDKPETEKRFNIEIQQDESVRQYYERIFAMLNKLYPTDLEKKIKGVSGRLSKSPDVTWRNKAKVTVGKETYTVNINLKRNVAEEFIKDLLFDLTRKDTHMSKELSPKYNPAEVEAGRYQKWLDEDVFKPSGDKKAKPYSIVIPPPNVTGKLHLGHAWDTTLQDIIIRQKRMQGFDTLWLPGMDHAGIATQAKVEARLAESGISRYDLGREKFLDKVWEWKDEYASTIKQQWGKMGISVDYSRERFTLDEGLSKAVRKVFVELYKKGWIYRGEFIINWDPKARTALSDIEVIHKDVEGAFYHMNYMLEDGSRALEVATTRPETMFGDTAVAVNPNDDRYKDLIGKNVILPILNKPIPIVGDEHADPEFGTGVVKITPAHDPNDFLVGQRHNLPQVNVMNDDGTMNELAGEFKGMDRFEARKAVVKKLEEIGALVEIEKMTHSVGHSERTGVPVEPRLSTQWFVKMDQLAKNAIANQDTDDKVDFYPPRFNDTFLQWMENVHDWVISRQLWWGHQIPAWYNAEGEMYVGEEAPEGDGWKQDEDVLDTWFSSALWPFSTMGWPDVEAEDFKRYFPTSTLVTGYDIIFFWVSRMIFQSLEFTGRQPFKNVLIHGLIRDEQGRKMSKSLGNGIDPMDVIEKYGADALRWFLSNGSAPGQDVRFSYEKMDASWNFINKIWNISRYILMNNEGLTLDVARENVAKVAAGQAGNVTDRWILHNLNETIGKVTENFDKFEFGVAGHILYNFIWDEFADWYVELTKEVLYSDNEDEKVITRSVLLYTLDQILRLLHPIMPFVTEEIYGQISEGTIVTAEYPVVRPEFENEEAAASVEALKDVISSVRNSRAEVNVAPSKPITILIKTSDSKLDAFFNDNVNYIKRFTNPEHLEIAADVEVPDLVMSSIITGAEIYLPLADLLNVEEELARLEKELAKWQKELDMVGKKLSNERFVANAKPEVVQKERDKQEDYQAKYDATVVRIEEMKKLVK